MPFYLLKMYRKLQRVESRVLAVIRMGKGGLWGCSHTPKGGLAQPWFSLMAKLLNTFTPPMQPPTAHFLSSCSKFLLPQVRQWLWPGHSGNQITETVSLEKKNYNLFSFHQLCPGLAPQMIAAIHPKEEICGVIFCAGQEQKEIRVFWERFCCSGNSRWLF